MAAEVRLREWKSACEKIATGAGKIVREVGMACLMA